MPITLAYPKPRGTLVKVIPIARTDSSTEKCWLPRDAVITGVFVHQTAAAVTGAATFNLGWPGSTTALLNAFSMPTTSVGFTTGGTATGTGLFTRLDTDRQVLATYAVGTSTAGGTGFVVIQYFVAGPGELATD